MAGGGGGDDDDTWKEGGAAALGAKSRGLEQTWELRVMAGGGGEDDTRQGTPEGGRLIY